VRGDLTISERRASMSGQRTGGVLERGVSQARARDRRPTGVQATAGRGEERGRQAIATKEPCLTGRPAPERPLAGRRDPPAEGCLRCVGVHDASPHVQSDQPVKHTYPESRV
jgi:hypothetical protein